MRELSLMDLAEYTMFGSYAEEAEDINLFPQNCIITKLREVK